MVGAPGSYLLLWDAWCLYPGTCSLRTDFPLIIPVWWSCLFPVGTLEPTDISSPEYSEVTLYTCYTLQVNNSGFLNCVWYYLALRILTVLWSVPSRQCPLWGVGLNTECSDPEVYQMKTRLDTMKVVRTDFNHSHTARGKEPCANWAYFDLHRGRWLGILKGREAVMGAAGEQGSAESRKWKLQKARSGTSMWSPSGFATWCGSELGSFPLLGAWRESPIFRRWLEQTASSFGSLEFSQSWLF
jgi:hypothetical protein